jgi:hypothetical protein
MLIALFVLVAIVFFFFGLAAGVSTGNSSSVELNYAMAKYIARVVHWNDTVGPTDFKVVPEELVTDGQKLVKDYRKELNK